MLKQITIFILAFLLVLPFVLGESSFVFKQDDTVDLKIPVTNSDNSIITTSTSCNITIRNGKDVILVQDGIMSFNSAGYFNYTLNDTSTLGQHPVFITCTDGADNGFSSFSFDITATGDILTTGTSIIYVIFLIAIIFTFGLTVWGAIAFPFKNKTNDLGHILSVNDLKYLKVICIVFSYVLLMFIFGVTRSILANYLFLNGAHRVFNWLFWFMFAFVYPLAILSFLFTLILFLESRKIKRILERGKPFRD